VHALKIKWGLYKATRAGQIAQIKINIFLKKKVNQNPQAPQNINFLFGPVGTGLESDDPLEAPNFL